MSPSLSNEFPDFLANGYKAIEQLGHNHAGGRITYKAVNIQTQQTVVIKQFQFKNFGSAWSGFKAYEREIEVLRGLNHRGIPGYLDAFEISTGFCMVQEYKDALSLAVTRSFTLSEVKHLAGALLEILVYLQNRVPRRKTREF